MNFYAILGVPRDADELTIRNAYKVLALRFHPDRGAGSSEEKFCEVNEAYQILSDPPSRRIYDASLSGSSRPPWRDDVTVSSRPPVMEDPAVFGHYDHGPRSTARNDRFDDWFDSLDEFFDTRL